MIVFFLVLSRLIQVDVQTHVYLQTLDPIQRALALAKLQKHQQKHGLFFNFFYVGMKYAEIRTSYFLQDSYSKAV